MKSYIRNCCSRVFSSRLASAAALALFAAGTLATAQDSKPEAPKPKKWDSVITLGAALTRGNSHTFQGNASILTKRTWAHDEALFGANAGYGENTVTSAQGNKVDTTTDSYIRGFGQWNHLFSPVTYGGVRVTGEHDDIAALTYRATVSPLVGYYFVKETNSFLAGEVGPSYVREKFFGEDVHDYIGLRIGERGEHKFDTGAKIWESLEWIPKVQDMQNYLLNLEAGVSAPISKSLSLSLVLQDSYKSIPATGKQKNDLRLIAGLSYNF